MYLTSFCDNPATMMSSDLGFGMYLTRAGISQSMLKTFDYDSGGCPALYKWQIEHPGQGRLVTQALLDGRRYHHFLLEPDSFGKYYAELTPEIEESLFVEAQKDGSKAKEFSRRLSTYFIWESLQAEAGRAVVTKEEATCLRDMRDAVLSNSEVAEWFDFKRSKLEVSMFAGWDQDGEQFQIKGRVDILPEGDAMLDLKTARTAHPDEFAKVAWRLGYHIQAAFYIDLARKNGLDKRRFGFLAQDKFPPYLACIHWLGEDWIRYGRIRYTKILLDIADAVRRNDWPGYRSGELMPPSWAQTEIESVAR